MTETRLTPVPDMPGVYESADGREVWTLTPVPDRPGVYVTADGNVWTSHPGESHVTRRKTTLNQYGYPVVWLDEKTGQIAVHILVCTAYHGPKPSPRHVVARNNRDRKDNRPENLRWDTKHAANLTAFEQRRKERREYAEKLAKGEPASPPAHYPAPAPGFVRAILDEIAKREK